MLDTDATDDGRRYQDVRHRRRQRNRVVYGTGDDGGLTAGLQRHNLFVFQVNKQITDQQVQDYLEKKEVHVVSIKRISADESPSNSYHVELHCMDVRPVMTPDFWPIGVGCRKYIQKSRWQRTAEQQQQEFS